MLRNDKPLATIIEGRWYSVGKSAKPTLELTRTQKRRVQSQYCTFLKNRDNTHVLPETSSTRKGKDPEVDTQTEQTTCQLEEMTKTGSPIKPSIHFASSLVNQPEPSQSEGQSEPISAEEQEDWIEEYEERLDYEPSTDIQIGLLETGEQEDWTEDYGEQQMEYDGELDEETEAFGAKLESLLQGDLGINMVFIMLEKFRVAEGQESTLEGDVEEVPEQQTPTAKAGITAIKLAAEQLCFSKPTKEMANHLRPLFITANFGGVPIPKVMVDGGVAINLLPHRLLLKMGRTEKDLIPTHLTVTNFAGGIIKTHGILDVDVIVGTKKLKIPFFVVDPRPFLPSALCFEARYYHDDLCPFTFFGVNQNSRPHGVTAQKLIEEVLKRKIGAVRICVDYRNLNEASSRDEYRMPMVDGAAHNQMLSFVDGNVGYNQIMVTEEDIHKTAFMCPGHIGAFEYTVMPFGLRNAGATYQRAMNYVFHDMIGHSLEVYIDDVVIKFPEKGNHVSNLKKAFLRMRQHMLKMNPKKCVFGVQAGSFLGFLVHQRGIEIDKNKAKSIMEALPPRNKKELQSLLGKINFLRRFISNSAGKIQPFSFLLRLKQEQTFKWEEQHQQAFEEIKHYLSNPPVLYMFLHQKYPLGVC
ncbi:unnamed protein product [Prunus brigantina]